jgi:hypothetical protein
MSGTIRAKARMRKSSLEAVVIRADGRRERLGTIAYYHWFPPFRWAWRAGRALKRAIAWLHS